MGKDRTMREIKFRVWRPSPEEGNPAYLPFVMVGLSLTPVRPEELNCVCVQDGDVVMQYTGLKDKNGKEIYEGDVVNEGNEHWENSNTELHDRTGFVAYLDDDCNFQAINDWHGIKVKNKCHNSWFRLSEQCEVIGNIYENPELLDELDKETR